MNDPGADVPISQAAHDVERNTKEDHEEALAEEEQLLVQSR